MTKFQENHIHGSSAKLSKKDGIRDNFDLFICSCGWESRCLEVIEYDKGYFSFDSAAIISFKLGDDIGYAPEFMTKLKSFIEEKIDKDVEFIEHEVTELDLITGHIKELILKLIKDLNRPLCIGFDITCCPRYVFLYLLGYCLRYDLAKKISFFYSEGVYGKDPTDYIHTKGLWRIIEIPELEARSYRPNKKLFVISAGWEGSRYRRLIAKYEPDNLGILLPNPGFTPKYTEKSKKECSPLIDEYNIAEDAIVSAPAGDAIAAWEALKAPSLNKKDYHIAYLTFGPKPHALAMGIRGYLHDEISVLYRIPDGYIKIDSSPNDNFWRYDIENLIFI